MVWLSRAKLALPLPQIEAIADIRARVIQNPGYANSCDIVSGFEIFSALNWPMIRKYMRYADIADASLCFHTVFDYDNRCPSTPIWQTLQ